MGNKSQLVELTADIAAAYLSGNSVAASELPTLLQSIHGALSAVSSGAAPVDAAAPLPAVPIKKSITPDHLISLEDGRKYKSLKRHLRTKYNMSPEDYRSKWGLPKDYPMVAPNYAKARSEMARNMGLGQAGRGGRGAATESGSSLAPPAEAASAPTAVARGRGRPKKKTEETTSEAPPAKRGRGRPKKSST